MQSIFALPRRALRAVTALAMITVLVGLMSFGASAQADPYPPSTPTHPASTPTDPVTSVTTRVLVSVAVVGDWGVVVDGR